MLRALLLIVIQILARAGACQPDPAEQRTIIDSITGQARNYAQSLPNFLAARVTKRFVDASGGGHQWRQTDTMEQQLTYSDHRETYKLTTVNGRPAVADLTPGLTTGGEFGSAFEDIFSAKTLADFKWKRCQSLRGAVMYVVEYRETKARSVVAFEMPGTHHIVHTDASYHGLIYADPKTTKVMRLTIITEVPKNFPMQGLDRQLDYGWTLVGGSEYLLPSRVEVSAKALQALMRNETNFLLYRKFEAESVLKFDKK